MALLGGQHTLSEHDARYPDANAVVGGPYLAGYDPITPINTLRAGDQAAPVSAYSQGGNKATFTAVALTTIQGEASSGDRVGSAVNYHTEDHVETPQP